MRWHYTDANGWSGIKEANEILLSTEGIEQGQAGGRLAQC